METVDSKGLIKYAIESYLDELLASEIYKKLAEHSKDESLNNKLIKASEMERRHSEFWKKFLERRGVNTEDYKINPLKVKFSLLLYRILGLGLTLRILERGERKAIETYSIILSNEGLSEDERAEIKRILEDELLHEEDFLEEGKFKEFLNHIRDAVLGMSDGLVEILSVSSGLAGAYGDPLYVALGGLIVGIGGALSMGIGAYINIKSQNQVKTGTLYRLSAAAKYATRALIDRVMRKLKEEGFNQDTLTALSRDLEEKPNLLSKLAISEEENVSSEDIENPLKAGLYTGLFYIIGSIFPLSPYFLMLPIPFSRPLSFLSAGLLLALTGFIIAISASLDVREKILEFVVAGSGAAFLTYLIGSLASLLFGIEVE